MQLLVISSKVATSPMVWVDSQRLLIHLHFLDVCELLKVLMQIHLKSLLEPLLPNQLDYRSQLNYCLKKCIGYVT